MESADKTDGQDDRISTTRVVSTANNESAALSRKRPVRGDALRKSLTLVTIAWLFGSVYFSSTSGAPITLFAQALGASKFQFGLLSAFPFLAAMLNLPSSLLIDKT